MRDEGRQYFRSDDPVEAARFVVSDAAALLWETVRERRFGAFAHQAALQLLRWESRYGWTHGWGQVCERETSLACVLTRILPAPDAWITFTAHYLAALDQAARADATASPRIYGSGGYGDTERTFLQARLARQRGDTAAAARKLIKDCQRALPGHQDFASFAAEIGDWRAGTSKYLLQRQPRHFAVADCGAPALSAGAAVTG